MMKNSPDRAGSSAPGGSRRRFLKLLAAGSAAAVAASVPAAGATRSRRRKPAPSAERAVTPASAKEIENQKQWVARSLDALRKHPLPQGNEPAFAFTPMPPRGESPLNGRRPPK